MPPRSPGPRSPVRRERQTVVALAGSLLHPLISRLADQIVTVRSPAAANRLPSWENAVAKITDEWEKTSGSAGVSSSNRAVSQSRTVWSHPQEASVRPSGENATASTSRVCPASTTRSREDDRGPWSSTTDARDGRQHDGDQPGIPTTRRSIWVHPLETPRRARSGRGIRPRSSESRLYRIWELRFEGRAGRGANARSPRAAGRLLVLPPLARSVHGPTVAPTIRERRGSSDARSGVGTCSIRRFPHQLMRGISESSRRAAPQSSHAVWAASFTRFATAAEVIPEGRGSQLQKQSSREAVALPSIYRRTAGPEFDKTFKKISGRRCVEGVRTGPYAISAESTCSPRVPPTRRGQQEFP